MSLALVVSLSVVQVVIGSTCARGWRVEEVNILKIKLSDHRRPYSRAVGNCTVSGFLGIGHTVETLQLDISGDGLSRGSVRVQKLNTQHPCI